MTYTAPDIAWAPLVPIIVVLVAGAVGVLIEAFMRSVAMRRMVQLQLAVVALVLSAFAIVWQWVAIDGAGVVVLSNMISLDRQALAWQFLLVVFAIGGVLLFADRNREGEDAFTPLASVAPGSSEETVARAKGMAVTESFPLLMLATGGMMLFATVNDLLFLFVALELF
ncbi:MAG: NADH-quinone oxidoreductase subunit N, partial [Demequina sp.]|nr:NADH-quinone oxidoreductase subunit N [Demequina sp.]